MDKRVVANLKQGNNVIFDGNLLTNSERWRALENFQPYGSVLFLGLAISESVALKRAMSRGNELDPLYHEHIHTMYQAFEPLDPALPSLQLDATADYSELEQQVQRTLPAR